MKPISLPLLITFLLTLFLPLDSVYPADPSAVQVTSQAPISAEVLSAKIKEVEANVDLDEGMKAELTNRYRTALSNLEMANSHQKTAEEFLKSRKTAPEQTRKIREELEQAKESSKVSPSDVKLKITKDTPLPEIEQLLNQEEASFTAIQASLSDAKEQLDNMLNRPTVVQKRLVEAKERQKKIANEIKMPAPKTESPREKEVRHWLLVTEELALREEIKLLGAELLSQPMRIELLRAYIDKMVWEVKPVETLVYKLRDKVNELHIAQAEKTQMEAQVAQQLAKGKHLLVQLMAKKNALLSEDISF